MYVLKRDQLTYAPVAIINTPMDRHLAMHGRQGQIGLYKKQTTLIMWNKKCVGINLSLLYHK